MRIAAAGLIAALLLPGCLSAPGESRAEAALTAYRQGLRSGTAGEHDVDAVVNAELAGVDPGLLPAAARAAAQRHHELALAAGPDEAVAREEVAWALLARGCGSCARQQIPVLLHLVQLQTQRGDPAGLARCAERARRLDARGLDAGRLTDWTPLKQLGELSERVEDFERAAEIERSLLDAKLQILDASHPQVESSRERIAELERRALRIPPVGAAPPDPAR